MFHCFSSILQRWQKLDQLKRKMETFESTALKRKMETEYVQLLNAFFQVSIFRNCEKYSANASI